MLFHKDVYFPELFQEIKLQGILTYTNHAIEASKNDKYGAIELPISFNSSNATLIECEICPEQGKIIKTVYRQPLDENRDIILVIIPENLRVKTVWINHKTDTHKTLDIQKYVNKPLKISKK